MKILQINSVLNLSSTGRIVSDLSRLMTSEQIENLVIYGIGAGVDNIPAYRAESDIEVKLSILLMRLFGRQSCYSRIPTKRMIRKINEFKPDLVHIHQMHGHYINMNMLFEYLIQNNIPTVWTCHDCWAFTGHCSHFTKIGCLKWRTGCGHCGQKHEYPISWFFDRSSKNWREKKALYDSFKKIYVITPSKWLADFAKQSILGEHKIKCIYNGVDRNFFKHVDSTAFVDKYKLRNKHILFSVKKEETPFWKTFYKELSGKLKDDEILVIADCKTTFFSEKIVKLPYLCAEELRMAYSSAEVYINASFQESFGMIQAEALSCGTPTIVCNGTAIPEITGNCGIVLDNFNADNVYNAVCKIRNNRDDYSPLCSKRVSEFFDKDKNYKKYIELYKEILNKKKEVEL